MGRGAGLYLAVLIDYYRAVPLRDGFPGALKVYNRWVQCRTGSALLVGQRWTPIEQYRTVRRRTPAVGRGTDRYCTVMHGLVLFGTVKYGVVQA